MGGLSGTVRDVYRPVQDLHGRPCGFQSSAAGMVPAGDAVQVEVPAEGGLGGQPSKEYLSCMSITALPLTYAQYQNIRTGRHCTLYFMSKREKVFSSSTPTWFS